MINEEINQAIKIIQEHNTSPERYYDFCGYSTLELMFYTYGIDSLKCFCKLNAFKYRMRVGKKTIDHGKDISKANYYEELWYKLDNII